MQNAGIYHIAAQKCVHRNITALTQQQVFPGDPAGGLASRPPIPRASRSFSIPPTFLHYFYICLLRVDKMIQCNDDVTRCHNNVYVMRLMPL